MCLGLLDNNIFGKQKNNGDGKEDAGNLEKNKVLDYTLEKSNTERWELWKKRYGKRYVFFQLFPLGLLSAYEFEALSFYQRPLMGMKYD